MRLWDLFRTSLANSNPQHELCEKPMDVLGKKNQFETDLEQGW